MQPRLFTAESDEQEIKRLLHAIALVMPRKFQEPCHAGSIIIRPVMNFIRIAPVEQLAMPEMVIMRADDHRARSAVVDITQHVLAAQVVVVPAGKHEMLEVLSRNGRLQPY